MNITLELELIIPPEMAWQLVFFTHEMELLYNLREQWLIDD